MKTKALKTPKEDTTPDNTVYEQEKDPNGDYVTIAEYIRRRHAADLLKDATASALYHTSLLQPIRKGYIHVYQEGNNKFINWNKYRTYLFRRNFQLPVPKTKK